jgi:hypothetical protein
MDSLGGTLVIVIVILAAVVGALILLGIDRRGRG